MSANDTAKTTTKPAVESGERESEPTEKLPWLVRRWLRLVDYLSSSFLGGPHWIKLAHVINFQKGCTLLVSLGMMQYARNYTPTAAVYTALHGGYGLCWLLKEAVFPDPKWNTKITIGSALVVFSTVLGPYWLIAYNAIVRHAERSSSLLCGAGIVYSIGLCLMMCADCQKYFVLKLSPRFITDGFFARVRHPNYLGEMMIYGSFAFVSNAKSSWLVLGLVWSGLFLPYMLRKEARMSRHPGWAAYKARTGFLLPRIVVSSNQNKSNS